MIWNISGCEVLIDDEDYAKVTQYKYTINTAIVKKHGRCYFQRHLCIDGRRTITTLHRDIMGCFNGDDRFVDHINGNTLDNRKCNLRICTNAENSRNCKTPKRNTSGVKGVSWHMTRNKWRAQIRYNGKRVHLGLFADINDAAKAYAEASKKYHGEFGRLG